MKPRDAGADKGGARFPASGRGRRRALFCACALLMLLSFGAGCARAACPSGFSLYMPATKASQPDRLYSLLAAPWQARFQEPLHLVHVPGRGGSYATSRLLDEESDGCSLAAVILPSVYLLSKTADSMYDVSGLNVAAVLASASNALWVAEESSFHTLADLVNFARAENTKADGVFTLAGTGRYTDQHLATLEFDRAAGVKSLYLPVLGSTEAADAVKSGAATACWGYALLPESMPGMRALGVAGERRSPALPAAPTFREVQVDMVNVAHFALAVRATMPEDDMRQLRSSLAALASDHDLRGRMAAGGFIPLALEPRDIAAFLEGQLLEIERNLSDYPLIPNQPRR